jgi:hypothetical protein
VAFVHPTIEFVTLAMLPKKASSTSRGEGLEAGTFRRYHAPSKGTYDNPATVASSLRDLLRAHPTGPGTPRRLCSTIWTMPGIAEQEFDRDSYTCERDMLEDRGRGFYARDEER